LSEAIYLFSLKLLYLLSPVLVLFDENMISEIEI